MVHSVNLSNGLNKVHESDTLTKRRQTGHVTKECVGINESVWRRLRFKSDCASICAACVFEPGVFYTILTTV